MPDNWLRYPDPWEVARPYVSVTIPLNCSFIVRDGALRAIAGRDSSLYRNSVRPAGCRLWREKYQYAAVVGRFRSRLF